MKEKEKKLIKEHLKNRKEYLAKDFEEYLDTQTKLQNIAFKQMKGANWMIILWAIIPILFATPFVIGFYISVQIEKLIKKIISRWK